MHISTALFHKSYRNILGIYIFNSVHMCLFFRLNDDFSVLDESDKVQRNSVTIIVIVIF